MKTLRLVAICAFALFLGQAWAQDKPVASEAPSAAQDVGGTPSSSTGEAGHAMQVSRQQVYQDLVRSQQSGEQARLWSDLYRGGQ